MSNTLMLVVGKPIAPPPLLAEVYKLTLTFMHGDADAYTNEVKFVSDKDSKGLEQLLDFVVILKQALIAEPRNLKDWKAVASFVGIDPEVIDDLRDYIASDCTTSYMAMLDKWKITYFDLNGVEHEVNVVEVKV